MPTIKDVANLAGVSFKTVSRVINRDPAVRDLTRQRVEEAMSTLGYRPNAAAQVLRRQRTHIIGFMSDEIGTSVFAGQSLQGAQDQAWEQNILMLSVNTSRHPDRKKAAVEVLLNRQVEGIIYAAMYHREVEPPEALRTIPTVLMDCFVADQSLPSVVPDEVSGGYTATTYLLEKGYRRIGMLNYIHDQPASVGRYQGYRQALAEWGIEPVEDWIVRDLGRPDGGYRATLELLQQAPTIEAIFCFNDRMALGAYQALGELGRTIPDDVAVVGFDNEPHLGEWLRPPLSTLELPHYRMGQWAVDHLLAQIDVEHSGRKDFGGENTNEQEKLSCPLIARASA